MVKLLRLLPLILFLCFDRLSTDSAQAQHWVSGYIGAWNLNMAGVPHTGASNYGECPYYAIDYNCFTHIIAFPAGFRSNGQMNVWTDKDDILDTLHTATNGDLMWGNSGLYSARRKPFNDTVHAHGKPILLSFFCGGISWTRMVGSETARNTACQTIVDSVVGPTYRYDGVDFDIEAWATSDSTNTRIFLIQVYDTLQKHHAWYDTTKKPIMTTASTAASEVKTWIALMPYFDQMNHMSYDMFNGTYTTVVWHNNAIFRAGAAGYGNSIQGRLQALKDSGIISTKLGAGLDLNGRQCRGGKVVRGVGDTSEVLYPLDAWVNIYPPTIDGVERKYWQIYDDFLDTATTSLRYDTNRKVPYLSLPGNQGRGSGYPTYVTFEDTSTMREGILYADTANLGGVIVWGITDAYLNASRYPDVTKLPGQKRDAMIQALKTEADRLGWYEEISALPQILSFGNIIIGYVSNSMTITISGSDFTTETGNVSITMPPGFTVSTQEGIDYVSILSIPYTGGELSTTTLYVIFSPVVEQSYTGDIIVTGGGIGEARVKVDGIGTAIPIPETKCHYNQTRFWR